VFATNQHGIYCVPRSCLHRPVSRAVLRSRVWEADTLELMRNVDSHGDIVHAGTFFGDFLPALARSRRDDALVWAFEPSRESYRCAQVTVLLNDLENVVLTHAALDANGGTGLLATSDRSGRPTGGASHMIRDPSSAGLRTNEEVRLVSLDDVIARDRHVAIIQLDVEGYEQRALEGAMGTIERCRPLLVLEGLPHKSWFAANLEPLGYRVDGPVNSNAVVGCHRTDETLRAAGASG
jgi:FkbM family methyltransferase